MVEKVYHTQKLSIDKYSKMEYNIKYGAITVRDPVTKIPNFAFVASAKAKNELNAHLGSFPTFCPHSTFSKDDASLLR